MIKFDAYEVSYRTKPGGGFAVTFHCSSETEQVLNIGKLAAFLIAPQDMNITVTPKGDSND